MMHTVEGGRRLILYLAMEGEMHYSQLHNASNMISLLRPVRRREMHGCPRKTEARTDVLMPIMMNDLIDVSATIGFC